MYLASPSHGVPGLTELLPHRVLLGAIQGKKGMGLTFGDDLDLPGVELGAAAVLERVQAQRPLHVHRPQPGEGQSLPQRGKVGLLRLGAAAEVLLKF